MTGPSTEMTAADLEDYVEAYESAAAAGIDVAVERYFPPTSHPHYAEIAVEILRVDLELSWQRDAPSSLATYRSRFAEVLSDCRRMESLAFEEYRLRGQAGHWATPEEYAKGYGIDVANWPRLAPVDASETRSTFPKPGERFLDFDLDEELGRGSFGRVFLARQVGLAGRQVALKVSAGRSVEPERLAQLQHTNIVPIYSVHEAGGLQAVCMPFLGRATLADALGELHKRKAPPRSGAELISTVVVLDDTEGGESSASLEAEKDSDAPNRQSLPVAMAPSIRGRFERSSFVDAVVWIGAQLAAGLAHAHERGILHRDLKPANILLADDGRPMILDFNLSDRVEAGVRGAAIGGTLPYMAPEHLEALETGKGVDARSDVFSLGVLLFELLTRQPPYTTPASSIREAAGKLAADRRRAAPAARSLNSDIPHSVGAIVARCLAADPARRYQTADELRTDLERHLEHRPLAHAPDTSPRERLQKWARRHPRLSSSSTIGVFTLAIVGIGLFGWHSRGERLATLTAQSRAHDFIDDAPRIRIPLSLPGADPELIDEGLQAARSAVTAFGEFRDGEFKSASLRSHLPEADRSRLDAQLAKTFYVMASSAAKLAHTAHADDVRAAHLREAVRDNALAVAILGVDDSPLKRTTLAQQAALAGTNPSAAMSITSQERGEATSSDDGDRELTILGLMSAGRFADAIPLATAWRNETPTDVSAWMTLGHAQLRIGNLSEAEECFSACAAICPDFPLSYFQRGITRLEAGDLQGAVDDFTRVLVMGGCRAPALINRALARRGLCQYTEAVADLDAAFAAGARQTRIYFIRADLRRRLNQDADAGRDFKRGLDETPADAASWLARGMARLSDDPEGALADFRQAEALAPGSRAVLQNIVHVLGDRLGREDEARRSLDKMLAAQPRDASALASRSVVRARLGDYSGALADAATAVKIDHGPTILLQAACAMSIASSARPEAATNALTLLGRAVGIEPSLAARAETDEDLAAIRGHQEFARVIAAAKVLAAGGQASSDPKASP